MSIQLDGGVIIDGENRLVIFPVGNSIVLKFTFEEWGDFVALVSDANLVFETNTSVNSYQCGACGSINEVLDYEEPEEGDYH